MAGHSGVPHGEDAREPGGLPSREESAQAEQAAREGASFAERALAIRVLDRCCVPFLLQACAASDFHVTYYVLVTMGSSSQYAGQFLPTNAQWGIPLFAPSTTALTVYPQGALVLDAASPTPGDVVWRGLGEAKIEIEKQLTDAQRAARLTALIKDVVAKFPKKK